MASRAAKKPQASPQQLEDLQKLISQAKAFREDLRAEDGVSEDERSAIESRLQLVLARKRWERLVDDIARKVTHAESAQHNAALNLGPLAGAIDRAEAVAEAGENARGRAVHQVAHALASAMSSVEDAYNVPRGLRSELAGLEEQRGELEAEIRELEVELGC